MMKKTIFPFLLLTLLSFVSWQSCNRFEETGSISFGMEDFSGEQTLKSTPGVRPFEALVTIIDENGQTIFDKEPLPLYNFGNELVTKSLELPVGTFSLEEFMLVDTMGNVLWAAPREGSGLAGLVEDPLPIYFGVSASQTTRVRVEVVGVDGYQPSDFGYASFVVDFVNRFCLKVYYESCHPVDWNDTIINPDGSLRYYCSPRLLAWTGGHKVLDQVLYYGLNQYPLPISETGYRLAAVNCLGDTFYHRRLTLEELLLHRCRPECEPLYIHDGNPDSLVYITPEGLTEPTINQGVFGMITGPAADSTNTGEYGVKPLVRDVYFFPYYALDSILIWMGPQTCLYPEVLPFPPLFISRSNTSGYFQAELDPGIYLYMVKEEGGFYIDLYISSRIPGRVEVYENEVTKLYIHVIDCSMWY